MFTFRRSRDDHAREDWSAGERPRSRRGLSWLGWLSAGGSMLLLSLLALVGISPAVAQMTKVGQITEFGPLTGALLNAIIKGSDGALWFTEPKTGIGNIGRITTQ